MIAHPIRIGATLLVATSMRMTLGVSLAQERSATQVGGSQPGPEESAVREMIHKLVEAFNAKNTDALGPLITDTVLLVDSEGVSTSGREAVIAHYADAFAEDPEAKIAGTLESLVPLTPDVARGEGSFTLDDAPDSAASTKGRFSILAVRSGGTWRLAELRDYPAPAEEAASNEEYLREFEWMIGNWVDESDNIRVTSEIRWALDRNYILRDYSIELEGKQAVTGLMVLGYDPQVGQVKSWVFDSEGGQGEAYWSRVDDKQWVIRSSGHLRDGTPTSASQVVTLQSDDVVRQNSLDRMIGDQLAPEITEVIMVRRPPSPSVTPDAKPKGTDAEPKGSGASTQPAPASAKPDGR